MEIIIGIFVVVGIIIGLMFVTLGITILDGWVAYVIYNWFIFKEINIPLSMWVFVGFFMILSARKINTEEMDLKTEEGKKKFTKTILNGILTPLVVLLFAWIIKCVFIK